MEVEKGQRLGEYLLEGLLGRGGFCEVWRARHVMLGDVVAVKVATDEQMADFLRREGLAQRALEHPNIVRVLGGDTDAHPPYLVTEFMAGGSLRALLRRRRKLPQDETARIIKDVAAALQFAHQRGIVHRDVKPENILLDGEGKAKVADFGFWRFFEKQKDNRHLALSLLSTEEVMGGTLEYMSPEQRRGEEPTPADDVYALGVVLFECLTGRLPAPGDRIADFVDVGENFETAFSGAFVRREKRFSDVKSFLNALFSSPWRTEEHHARRSIFVEEEKESPPAVRQDAVKVALRFLRHMGADVREECLRGRRRRGDVLELVFSERLGVVEFLYTVCVKDGEVVGYNRRKRRR